ncbi:hypothetical protein ACSQ76_12485 [Roseovarius sp. B08]|uniref:hypothetical protein n=1 Tax=Roseovarius sp. B08 TaxID=3449223 RepID=UPI003EDC07A1
MKNGPELPAEIMVWHSTPNLTHIGTWATTRYPDHAVGYVRKERLTPGARPLEDWHEDLGFVVWWKFPVDEPAWIGTPNDSDWPGYHTHFTPHPEIPCERSD